MIPINMTDNILEKYISRSDLCSWRIVVGEAVVLTRAMKLHVLNETATIIWQLADGETKIRDIVNEICESFGVGIETAERDVLDFISELEKTELVIIGDQASDA